MNRILEQVQNGDFDLVKMFTGNKDKFLEVKTAIESISNNLTKETCMEFLLSKIIPVAFDKNVDNAARDEAIEIGFHLLKFVNVSVLTTKEQESIFISIEETYTKTIGELRDNNYSNWDKLWIFLIRLCHEKIHTKMSLANKLLRVVEVAFRNSTSIEQRLKAYDCWMELIDNCSINMEHMCSAKQIKLLVTPMKAKFSRMPIVIMKRCDTFVYLLEKLQDKSTLCLKEFLQFCFGPFEEKNDVEKMRQGKSVPEVCVKSTKVLIKIIGHSHNNSDNCVESDDIKLEPIINDRNFPDFAEILINSIIECCILLNEWNQDSSSNNSIIKCLWRSLLHLIHQSNDDTKKKCCTQINHSLRKLLERLECDKHYNVILGNVLDLLIKDDLVENLREILFDAAMNLLRRIPIDPGIFDVEAVLNFIDSCFEAENGSKFGKIALNFFKNDTKCVNSNTLCEIWLKCNVTISSSNISNLIWPVRHLQNFKDVKALYSKWTRHYSTDCKAETMKVSIMQELERLFLENPLLSSNIISFLQLMSTAETNSSKDFVAKFMRLIELVLTLPNLSDTDIKKLSTIVLTYCDQGQFLYKSENNEEALDKLCGCLEHIITIHKDYSILTELTLRLKEAQPKNLAKFSKRIMTVLESLMLNEDNSIANTTRKLIELLETKENEPETIPLTSTRSLRIINMANVAPKSSRLSGQVNNLRLFGKDVDVTSPITLRGSKLEPGSPGKRRSTRTKKKRDSTVPISEDKSSDYVKIDTEVKIDLTNLSDHQKEVLKKRREDIPALYQDLTQSQSREFFSDSNDTKTKEEPVTLSKDNKEPASKVQERKGSDDNETLAELIRKNFKLPTKAETKKTDADKTSSNTTEVGESGDEDLIKSIEDVIGTDIPNIETDLTEAVQDDTKIAEVVEEVLKEAIEGVVETEISEIGDDDLTKTIDELEANTLKQNKSITESPKTDESGHQRSLRKSTRQIQRRQKECERDEQPKQEENENVNKSGQEAGNIELKTEEEKQLENDKEQSPSKLIEEKVQEKSVRKSKRQLKQRQKESTKEGESDNPSATKDQVESIEEKAPETTSKENEDKKLDENSQRKSKRQTKQRQKENKTQNETINKTLEKTDVSVNEDVTQDAVEESFEDLLLKIDKRIEENKRSATKNVIEDTEAKSRKNKRPSKKDKEKHESSKALADGNQNKILTLNDTDPKKLQEDEAKHKRSPPKKQIKRFSFPQTKKPADNSAFSDVYEFTGDEEFAVEEVKKSSKKKKRSLGFDRESYVSKRKKKGKKESSEQDPFVPFHVTADCSTPLPLSKSQSLRAVPSPQEGETITIVITRSPVDAEKGPKEDKVASPSSDKSLSPRRRARRGQTTPEPEELRLNSENIIESSQDPTDLNVTQRRSSVNRSKTRSPKKNEVSMGEGGSPSEVAPPLIKRRTRSSSVEKRSDESLPDTESIVESNERTVDDGAKTEIAALVSTQPKISRRLSLTEVSERNVHLSKRVKRSQSLDKFDFDSNEISVSLSTDLAAMFDGVSEVKASPQKIGEALADTETCKMATTGSEISENNTLTLSGPQSNSAEDLPSSPITCDTPDRTMELLNNTSDISPINSKHEEAMSTPIQKQSNEITNWRVARLLQMVNSNVQVSNVGRRWFGNKHSSPSGSKVRRMRLKKEENLDILTFSREVPSPLTVPASGILKRKFTDETAAPSPKRKRVNFSDPAITAKKIFIKEAEEYETNGDLDQNTDSTKESQISTDTEELCDTEKVFLDALSREEMILSIKEFCDSKLKGVSVDNSDLKSALKRLIQNLQVPEVVEVISDHLLNIDFEGINGIMTALEEDGTTKVENLEVFETVLPKLFDIIENLSNEKLQCFIKEIINVFGENQMRSCIIKEFTQKQIEDHVINKFDCDKMNDLIKKYFLNLTEQNRHQFLINLMELASNELPVNKELINCHVNILHNFVRRMTD